MYEDLVRWLMSIMPILEMNFFTAELSSPTRSSVSLKLARSSLFSGGSMLFRKLVSVLMPDEEASDLDLGC